ncbi:hypothetical protein CKM354_000138400 [Cercospora kikuchii]|uniref:Uncharacterized protein n=1 Tax=Cercospora kikuchii TaxID=84275 RepID=A0A9P3CAL0_9PEZI|nr:uncharacterized protein CKM354_000138400 [Cercospora kikuchii]GIZ37956.1 hypothetical protein CKM354_000138400 [Cercospora kikuchii]
MERSAQPGEMQADAMVQDAFNGFLNALDARSDDRFDALEKKHEKANQVIQEQQKALQSSVSALREQCEERSKSFGAETAAIWDALKQFKKEHDERHSTLSAANAESLAHLSSMRDGLTAVHKMVTDLGQQIGEHDTTSLSDELEQVKESVQTLLQQQQTTVRALVEERNGLQMKLQQQEPLVRTILGATDKLVQVPKSSLRVVPATDERPLLLPQPLQESNRNNQDAAEDSEEPAQLRSPSSATFRGSPPDKSNDRQAFDGSMAFTLTSRKRTTTQRQSESFDEELKMPHKRSGSLQRKRATINLKKASADSVPESTFAPRKPSSLQRIFTATDATEDDYEIGSGSGSDVSSEIIVTRSQPAPAHLTSEFSPASQGVYQKILNGQSAIDSLKTLGANPSPKAQPPPWSQVSGAKVPPARLDGGHNSISTQVSQQTELSPEPVVGLTDTSLPGLFSNSQPLAMAGQAPYGPAQPSRDPSPSKQPVQMLSAPTGGRRRSSREAKKKGVPDDFVDLRTLKNDKVLGLVPKRD